jgi:hypothetical protein
LGGYHNGKSICPLFDSDRHIYIQCPASAAAPSNARRRPLKAEVGWTAITIPFSVSRINQIVSLFITVFWIGLAVHAFPFSQAIRPTRSVAYWIMAAFTVVFILLLLWLGWPKNKLTRRPIRFDIAEFNEENLKGDTSSISNMQSPKQTKKIVNATKKVIDNERKKRLLVILWILLSSFGLG